MTIRSKVPILLASVLFVVVGVLGSLRVWASSGPQFAVELTSIVVYLAWLVAETCLASCRELSLPDAPRDKSSCELYAISQGATVILALLVPSATGVALGIGALVLMLGGIALRLSAIVTLGRFYSRRVRLLDDHQVVTTGPYQLVRHPAYLGVLAGHLGFILVFAHWLPLVVWAALYLPMVLRRIAVEEPVLFELAGYADYAERKKRLVPLVW
jgi:protein-S-isoprenylcysteine O-methyltransferase Ste14